MQVWCSASVVWSSGMHDLHDSWFLAYKGKSGTPYLGQTLQHSAFLLLTQRRSTRTPNCQRQLHSPSERTGRTKPPDGKDNGGAAVLAENIRRRRRLVSEMRWRYVSLEFSHYFLLLLFAFFGSRALSFSGPLLSVSVDFYMYVCMCVRNFEVQYLENQRC